MAELRNCGSCDYLRRTSPEQVFLLCEFWSAERPPIPDVFRKFGHEYVVTHCHMQPEAPACPFWVNRKDRELTDKKISETLSRYSADLYAEFTRMTVKQLRTYANQHHVPLGGESIKAAIIQEMVGQLRHRKSLELTGE